MSLLIPVILSGGSGTRLWPLSRQSVPKQFVSLLGDSSGSLFSMTVERLKPFGSPWSLTVQNLNVLTEREFTTHKISKDQIIYEPFGRNTAPALALLCKVLSLKGLGQRIVGVFPADHLVQKTEVFARALELAGACAEKGQVVTLGIKPTYAATGYGYIEVTAESFLTEKTLSAHRVAGFREKPDAKKADEFLKSGHHYWNAGMFIFKTSTLIEAFKSQMPELWKAIDTLSPDLKNLASIYEKLKPQSIDYGIMEHLKEQVCIPCDIGWSDMGSWEEVAALKKGEPLVEEQSHGNFVKGQNDKTYAFVGVNDLVVVDTPDACLISKKGESQKVKEVVETLKSKNVPAATEHTYDIRPWGQFEVLRDTEFFKSKVIQVLPMAQLSYQSHTKRAEHWVITQGVGEVVLNDVVHSLAAGQSIHIPLGAKHRMRNPSATETLEFVEIQVGTYFGEDDITRYSDDYGRAP